MMLVVGFLFAALQAAAPAQQTRQAFEMEFGKGFAARKAVPAKMVDKSLLSGPKASDWTFALPLDAGSRLGFAKVTFKDGKYASGTLHYFGLPEMKMTAAEFSGLRRKFPMAGVCENPEAPVCLFHPTEKALSHPVPASQAIGLSFLPINELYGQFVANLHRLRVKTDDIAFRVDFTGSDGRSFPLGKVQNVRGKDRLEQPTILKSLAQGCPKLVSERELVEYFLAGNVAFVPVGVE